MTVCSRKSTSDFRATAQTNDAFWPDAAYARFARTAVTNYRLPQANIAHHSIPLGLNCSPTIICITDQLRITNISTGKKTSS
jgi:hypothetical protein